MVEELVINGLPVAPPPLANAVVALPRGTMAALRDLCRWAEGHLGMPLDSAMLDVLNALQSIHAQGRHAYVAELASVADVELADAQRVVAKLAGAQALRVVGEAGQRHVEITPRLAPILFELRTQMDHLLIARGDQREHLLLTRLSDPALRQLVENLFDRFHALEWLDLHNWGASCFLMSALVWQALQGMGWGARVLMGHVEAVRGKRRHLLGAPGRAGPGQIDGHAFVLLDERCVLDFGLGNARKQLNREFFWAIAADHKPGGPICAEVEHPRVGHVRWHLGWESAQGAAQLQQCQPLAAQLLRRYGFSCR